MEYVSTRGGMPPQPFSAILLEGLAPDGGLTVPASYPTLRGPELAQLRPLGYRRLAFALLSMFADDIPPAELEALIDRTYTAATFGSDDITPLLTLEPGVFLLRASNGPTLAFKDIAMQLLGNLFEHALAKGERDLNIVGATSGDTGSSAEYAMRGKRGIRVFMLSPKDRMSPFQTAQMYSLTDPNIFNIAIDGVFDDCQDVVKAIGGDAAFKRDMRIGTVNSINLGAGRRADRLLLQGLFRGDQEGYRAGLICRPFGQFRQHPRRARRAADGLADPPADPGDQ